MTTATANGTGRADRLAAALTTASPTLAPKQVERKRRPLKTHKPSGAVSWPLILIEGGEKSGKTWMFAELTASPRVGPSYLIDLTEGSAEEYGAVPGARYEVVELDGTFVDLIDQVENIAEIGATELAAGRPPVVLGIDTMGVDPGTDTSFGVNQLLLREHRLHLENLCGLGQMPPAGGWIVIGGLRIRAGSGSPATVFGLVP